MDPGKGSTFSRCHLRAQFSQWFLWTSAIAKVMTLLQSASPVTVYSMVHKIIYGTKARSLGFYPKHEGIVKKHYLTGLDHSVTYLAVMGFRDVVMKK